MTHPRLSQILTAVVLAFLLAGAAPAQQGGIGTQAPGAPAASTPANTPATPPLPDFVNSDIGSASRMADDPSIYRVVLTDGTVVYASESTLRRAIDSNGMPPNIRTNLLRAYPSLSARAFDNIMDSVVSNDPTRSLGQPRVMEVDGRSYVVTDDPMIPGNLVLNDAEGNMLVSMSYAAMMGVLDREGFTDAEKLEALKKFPFTLPQEVRERMRDMPREEQLAALREAMPKHRQLFNVVAKNEEAKVIPARADRPRSSDPTEGIPMFARTPTPMRGDSARAIDKALADAGKSRPDKVAPPAAPQPAPTSGVALGTVLAGVLGALIGGAAIFFLTRPK